MNENNKNEYSDEDNYSDSLSYNKAIFNSRVINFIYTGHNTINLSKVNSTLGDNKSIESFINKISLYEKKIVKEGKDNKNKIQKNDRMNDTNNKNEEQNINKKNSNMLVNSILIPVNNSFLKNKKIKIIKKILSRII